MPFLLALPAHRLAGRVLRLEPRLRRPAPIWRIRPLRHDALQTELTDVPVHGRAFAGQMLHEPDGATLGPPKQLLEPLLAVDQRQVAQVVKSSLLSAHLRLEQTAHLSAWRVLANCWHGFTNSSKRPVIQNSSVM